MKPRLRQYASQLQARRDRDPYYWLGLGLEELQQTRYPQAIAALERAQALTTGFEEVHRYLAIAYWRAGKPHMARDQLAVLDAMDRGDASVALLNKKFKHRPRRRTAAAVVGPHGPGHASWHCLSGA